MEDTKVVEGGCLITAPMFTEKVNAAGVDNYER